MGAASALGLAKVDWIRLGFDLLPCLFPPTSARVSVSCRPPQAYAGSGLRWEDLRQRGPGPPLLLTVPRPGGRARRPALRPDPGEQRPNSGGVERQDSFSPKLKLTNSVFLLCKKKKNLFNKTKGSKHKKYEIISFLCISLYVARVLVNLSFIFLSCTWTELIFKEVNSFKVSSSKTDSLQAEQ